MKSISRLFKTNPSMKYFSTQTVFNFKYPDVIIKEIKTAIENKSPIEESEIISNIHFFDSEQYTDIVSLLGKNKRGSNDLWDSLIRKAYDYELNFIQVKDLFNSICDLEKPIGDLEVLLTKNLAKTAGAKPTNERLTYELFI
jgi:hypothetical protein